MNMIAYVVKSRAGSCRVQWNMQFEPAIRTSSEWSSIVWLRVYVYDTRSSVLTLLLDRDNIWPDHRARREEASAAMLNGDTRKEVYGPKEKKSDIRSNA
jgi:hypothetical protein